MQKIIILLILITLPTLLPLFNTKFFYTQDYIFIARLHQMSTALSSGHFPVRWSPDLRFGEPTFNFYAPLLYYIGGAIRLLGLDFITISKILFILASIFSAITMYFFCKKLFNQKAAILGTVLYTYAPYRAVDIYVRGALSEAWAFVFFPLIFYTSLLVSEKANLKRMTFLSFSLAGLFLTHNVTALMFLPFVFFWWVYLVTKKHRRIGNSEISVFQLVLRFCGALILGISLAAFFLLPALFERQFIQTKYLLVGYFNFRAHFVAFFQFFSTFWGYGSSLWGPNDGMSFQVGLIHWAILGLAIIFGFIYRKDKKFLALFSFLGISFLISLFLQHNKSAFVWEAIPVMAFIQFPWRFLAITIFLVSVMGALISWKLTNKFKLIYFILITLVIVINIQYFKPRNYVDDSFFDKFLNVERMRRGEDLTKDYLPIWVTNPDDPYFKIPKAKMGEIEITNLKRKPTVLEISMKVSEQSVIEIPITYFPGWIVKANGQPIPQLPPSKQGLVRFELPKGEYQVQVEFKDTPIRVVGNLISLASLALTLSFLYTKKLRIT